MTHVNKECMQSSASEIQPDITGRGGREGRPVHIGRITLAACLTFWIFVFCDSGWGPQLVPLSTQLHISLSTAGLLYVAWSTGYLPGAIVGGAMLDRYGPRHVLFGASLIVLGGMMVIFLGLFIPRFVSIWILLIIAGLAGSGGGVIDAATNGLISAIYSEKRGMALNLFNLLYPLGGVLIALIDAVLLRIFHNNPQPAFLFTICFIVGAMFSLPGIPKTYMIGPGKSRANEETRNGIDRAPTLLVTLVPVIAVMVFTSGISSSVRAWTPAYLHVAYAQTPAIAAALSSIIWVLATLSRLVAAVLIVRIGAWRMVMLGIIVALIGFVAVMLSPNAFVATLSIALTSIGLSPIFATCLAIGSERAGRSFGSVTGILLFVSGISTVFCGWLFGFLLNSIGPLWSIGFCLGFIVLGGVMALRLRPSRVIKGE
jgi:MFS transporter, FHS family, glucose/mannose:H+ symporter